MKIFSSKTNQWFVDGLALVVGGGAEIDKAKIYAKEHGLDLIAIPTTGSGASETSHAVVWAETKQNVSTDKPISLLPPFEVKLDKTTRRNTCFDILGHMVDYLNVCSDNEVVGLGLFAGQLIEKHPTNLTHPRSYPLTLKGIPHGLAVGMVLKECIDIAFPLERQND